MAYIGNLPATGQNNSFRLLDDITSYTLTFDGSSASVVNSSDKTIESANHRFVQGQRVVYAAGGGTPVANLTGGTAYFIIKQGGSHFQLATTATNASNGVAISISAAGSATGHTLIASFDAVNTRFMASHSGGTKVNITRSAQLNISINGVIQEPQETASPTAGFGRDSGSVIVFSTAPNAGDAFWGSLVADNVPTFDISDNDVDNFTGDDSTTDFTLSKTPPDNRNILVTLDGVTQHPSDNTTTRAYTVTENVLSFTSAPSTSVSIQVRHIGFAGATGGGSGVTNFYGRTGSVVLKNTDTINVANIVDEGYLAVGSTASFGGNVSIGGTLTYDDVTYVEAVGLSTFKEGIHIPDSKHVLFGTLGAGKSTADFEIGHDANNNTVFHARVGELYVKGLAGAGNSIFMQPKNNESSAIFHPDGPVDLYNDNELKFQTIGYGVTVVGDLQTSGITTIHAGTNQQLFLNNPTTNGQSSIAFQSSKSTKWIIGSNRDSQADQDFFIFDNSNSKHRFNIKADGNIGIGTEDPAFNLHIYTSGYAGQVFQSQRIDYYDNIGGPLFYDHTGAVKAKVQSNVGGDLKFNSGGTDNRVVIKSTGEVGIGTTNPGKLLEIFGTDPSIKLRDSSGDAFALIEGDSADEGSIRFRADPLGAGANTKLKFDIDGTERLRITGAGITVTGEVAASQDYPNYRPTLDFNFAAEKKLDPRITYSRTGPASFVNEFGIVVLVGDNVPRFDYDPITRESKGLLIEESRTNILASSDPSNSVWIVDNSATKGANTTDTKDPAGTYTATKLMSVASAGSSSQIYDQTSHGSGGVVSAWAKKGTHNVLGIHDYSGGSGTIRAWFDLNTGEHRCEGGSKVAAGVQSSGNDSNTTNMIEYPNGWYRCIYYEAANMTYVFFRICDFDSDTEASASSNSIYLWGLQAEGSGVTFATSHIPCDTGVMPGTVTRGADIVDVDGEDFTDFYNQSEGTLLSSHTLIPNVPNTENVYVYQIQDASTNNVIRVVDRNSSYSNVATGIVLNGGSSQFHFNTTIDSYAKDKVLVALSVKQDDFAGCHNGGDLSLDNSGTLPTNFNSLGIGRYPPSGGYELNGHIQRFIYYPKQLSDSQLRTLTS